MWSKVADCPASGSCTTFKLDGMAIDITTAKFSSGALCRCPAIAAMSASKGRSTKHHADLTAAEVNVRKGETA